MIETRDFGRTLRLSLALVAGLTATACGDDTTSSKSDGDSDAQTGGQAGGGQNVPDLGPAGGSGGAPVGGAGGTPVGGSGGSGGGSGGAGGGNVKPDGGVGGGEGGAGGTPAGGSGGSGGEIPAGGSGGAPVGGSGGAIPAGGSGGDIPVGGQGGQGGVEPPPPVPNSDYAYSRIVSASIANAGEATCPDYTGDNRPDNAFAGIGPIANGQLQTAVDDGSLNLLPVSIGLPAGATDGRFAIAVLTGSANGNAYDVSPNALDADGNPLILFNPAEATNGDLQAGPGNFVLTLPVQGVEVILQLTQASITGTISVDGNSGLTIGNGTIAGQISQEDLNAALVVVPPDLAGLIPFFLQADLDTNGDNAPDAYSLCLTFAATPAIVNGFPVVAP
jgi:hypothetical protein